MMKTLPTTTVLVFVMILGATCSSAEQPEEQAVRSSIPFVATRLDEVRDMLWMAGVAEDDVVYDLGSGDGRIVLTAVRDFHARRAVGIEVDPELISKSRKNAEQAGVADRTEFIRGDLFKEDFGQASVVTLFLGHRANLKLRPKMFATFKPGTRIVSHQFGMGEWMPDKSLSVRRVALGMWGELKNPFMNNPRVPDYTANERHHGSDDKIHLWRVPASAAGVWRGKVETGSGPQELRLVLHQRLSQVAGSYQLSGQANWEGSAGAELQGEHLHLECRPRDKPYGRPSIMFDGHLHGHTMKGTLTITEDGKRREIPWEARREEADFCGTWQWPCATGEWTVGLRIVRRDGHLAATYLDRDREVPVTDFYDWGGGFYFTLLVNKLDDSSVLINEDTGWLIGEGVLKDGQLQGRIEFYPYSDTGNVEASKPTVRTWTRRKPQVAG